MSEHREDLAHQLGLALKTIAAPHQVHGHRVEWARPGQLHGETDGLFTDDEQVVLTLQVADCAPIYFYHRSSRMRGLVHAGWRGVGAGVVTASTDFMQAQGVALDQVEVIIGPAIERSCYEVGPEVVKSFPPTVWRPHSAGKFQLDLVAAIRDIVTNRERYLPLYALGPDREYHHTTFESVSKEAFSIPRWVDEALREYGGQSPDR